MEGAELMLDLNSDADAACRIQELQLRKQTDARMYLQAKRQMRHAISHEFDDISPLGVYLIPRMSLLPARHVACRAYLARVL